MICDISVAIFNLENSEKMFTKHFNNFKEKYASLDKEILKLIEVDEYDERAKLCLPVKRILGMFVLIIACVIINFRFVNKQRYS